VSNPNKEQEVAVEAEAVKTCSDLGRLAIIKDPAAGLFLQPMSQAGLFLTKVLCSLALVCLVQVFLMIWSKPRMAPWALEILKAFAVVRRCRLTL